MQELAGMSNLSLSNCILLDNYLFLNSLALGRFEWNFRKVIVKLILVIYDGSGISYKIAFSWLSLDLLMISQHWFR